MTKPKIMLAKSAAKPGTLYIVATPIGNLTDLSLRALDLLQSVDCIVAEDTRQTKKLLQHFAITKLLLSLHAHNENEKSANIINILQNGCSMALVSDAGTPLISDPGFSLVTLARQAQIPVIPIPGPCALITALSAAGVPCDTFTFVGFLPATTIARQNKLKSLCEIYHTIVFYEAKHRILDCLTDLSLIYGLDYEIVLAKELTKIFECFIRGTAKELHAWLLADAGHKLGEFVVILPARPEQSKDHLALLATLLNELPLKQAVRIASLITKENKNTLYKIALAVQNEQNAN